MVFIGFMGPQMRRVVRIIAGLGLIAVGLLGLGGVSGWVVAAVGLLPLASGLLDFCVLAPMFGRPLGGAQCRAGDAAVGNAPHAN